MYDYRFGRFEMALDVRRLAVDGAEIEVVMVVHRAMVEVTATIIHQMMRQLN